MLVKTLKTIFALIFFYTQDIKNIILNPKFYQHFFAISNNNLFEINKIQFSFTPRPSILQTRLHKLKANKF